MRYHIELEDGTTLASFMNKYDRDCCLDMLRKNYADMSNDYFTPVDK